MPAKCTRWETVDGRLFETESEANTWEATGRIKQNLTRFLDKLIAKELVASNRDVSAHRRVLTELPEYYKELAYILNGATVG